MSHKDAPLPEGKEKHDNSQKIGATLSKFGFYSKVVASEFDITDEELKFVERYDGDPIEPRLQQIQDRCGNHLYEDMTEIRLFLQCNGDLNELYDSLSSYLTTE